MNSDNFRNEYSSDGFKLSELDSNPIDQFLKWLDLAKNTPEIIEPFAFQLATTNEHNHPSIRTLLFRGIINQGFSFFTNYQSQKASHLSLNPNVSLLFFWPLLYKQVRIQGSVTKLSDKESDAYHQSRPKGAQISAWTSNQSQIIQNRDVLELKYKELELKYHDKPVPRPPHWGGYLVDPQKIEFWQGRPNRLHDRCLYTKKDQKWAKFRLAP